MSAMTIAIELVANNAAGGAFSGLISQANSLSRAFSGLGSIVGNLTPQMMGVGVAAAATGIVAKGLFDIVQAGVENAASLEMALTRLQLASQLGAGSFDVLKAAIIDLHIHSLYSTEQTAAAFEKLSEMGFTAAQTMYGVGAAEDEVTSHAYDATEALTGLGRQAMAVGEAMQTDAVTGATLLGTAIHTFAHDSLTAADAANILVGTFYNGVPSAEALQMALNSAGAMADTAGISFRDFSTVLGLLAQAGLPADQAGTSLRYMIQALIAPTNKQSQALNYLGVSMVNTSPLISDLERNLKASGGTAKQVADNYNGTTQALQQMFTQGQKLGFIPLGQTFNEWALKNNLLNSQLFDSQGQFKGLGNAVQVLDDAMTAKGMSMQQKMDLITQLFNVRSGRAAQILTNLDNFKAAYDREWDRIGKSNALDNANKVMGTFQGSIQVLGSTIESALAVAFMPLIQAMTPWVQKLNEVVGSFLKLNPQIQGAVGPIIAIVAAFLALTSIVLAVVFVATVLGGALAATFTVAGPIILAMVVQIGLLVGIFFAVRAAIAAAADPTSAFGGFLRGVGAAALVVWGWLTQLWQFLSSVFGPTFADIGNFLQNVIGKNFAGLSQTMSGVFLPAWQNLMQSIAQMKPLWDALLPVLQIIGVVLGVVLAVVIGVLIGLITGILGALVSVIAGIIQIFAGLVNIISGVLQVIMGVVQLVVGVIVAVFTGQWGKIPGIVMGALTQIWNGVKSILGGLLQVVIGIFQALIGGVIALVGGFITGVISFFTHLWETLVGHSIIPDMVNAIIMWIAKLPGEVLALIVGFVMSAITTFAQLVGQVVAAALDLERRVLAAINAMVNLALAYIRLWVSEGRALASNFVNGIIGFITNLPGRVAGVIQTLLTVARNLLGMLVKIGQDAGKGLIDNVVSAIKNGIAAVGSAVGAVASTIASFLHHSVPDEGPLADDDVWMVDFINNLAHGMTSRLHILKDAAAQVAATIQTSVNTPGTTAVAIRTAAPVAGSSGQVNIPINLDGKQIAQYTVDLATGQLKQSGMSRVIR